MISLIILAAGLSSRFSGNKLLAKISGIPIISKVVEESLKSNVDEVIVVLGHDSDRIRTALNNFNCRLVYNPDYSSGQSSSVKAGVKSISPDTQSVMILPGDVALVTSDDINKIIDNSTKNKNSIVCASFNKKMGHPILFTKSLFSEILLIDEKRFGLKSVVNSYSNDILKVEIDSNRILIDFDTVDDYVKYAS